MHLALFFLFLLLLTLLPQRSFISKDVILSLFFSVVYFALIWRDLYSHPYHHYLKHAFQYIARDLFLSAFALFALEILLFMVGIKPRAEYYFRCDLLLIIYYSLAQFMQFLWIAHLAKLGFFCKTTILVGSYDDRLPVEDLFQSINNSKKFVGQLEYANGQWHFRPSLADDEVPIRKSLDDFLFSQNVNELIICIDSRLPPEALSECAQWCRENSMGYYLIPDIQQLPHTSPWHDRFRTLPTIERFCPMRDSLVMISLKRGFDIIASTCALVLLSPLFALISILIKCEDGGSVFFVSTRVGIHGKRINFIKFRSMVPNAEALKAQLLASNERPDGPLFKMTNDPRVTRIGRFLRKTSLDEIPQFINVLKGDMSLIGPRPHLPSEVAAYSDRDSLRLECIPGISGLPQIYGRDTLGFREWVDLDLQYRKNWSLASDFSILGKTVAVVLAPLNRVFHGAH
jgi:exopolysaccharide biosynthesis polyprenyl glycosylphosphotransferase